MPCSVRRWKARGRARPCWFSCGAVDPETGARYTLKRYAGERVADGDSWRHAKITLHPVNPEFDPIVLTAADAGELTVVAELVEVLTAAAPAAARG